MSKVFVGDLSFEQNEESLRQIMAEYGVVIDAQVCVDKDGRPKGYGFVVFSDETSAELACTAAKQRGQRVWRVRSQAHLCVTPSGLALTPAAQVVTADSAHAETWLDDEYQLGPKVRDIRDHGAFGGPLPLLRRCWHQACLLTLWPSPGRRHHRVGGNGSAGRPAAALVDGCTGGSCQGRKSPGLASPVTTLLLHTAPFA